MFKSEIKISFYDCDPAGILFYANLFKFAHKNYEALIENFKLSSNYFNDDNFVVPIIHTEGNYFIHMKPGDKIEVLTYKFLNKDCKLCADVKTVHVFVDKKSFEKINIPAEILKNLKVNRD